MTAISDITVANQSSILKVKFTFSPKVSTLVNSAFQLWTTAATPIQISSPFRVIDTYNDFNSISRMITLFVTATLSPSTEYQLRVSGLQNGAGEPQTADAKNFTTEASVTPVTEPLPDVVEVTDHSIKITNLLDPDLLLVGSSGFSVDDSDPANGEYYLAVDHNNGRIIVKFSNPIASSYLNSTYFKAQRKLVQRAPIRWEAVGVQLTHDATNPWVFVDFPSEDATPVYNTAGHVYFVANYKYRVIVSKAIST